MAGRRVSGEAKRVRGSVTEALGKLSGDPAAQAQGAAQKREGEAEARAELASPPGEPAAEMP